VSAFLDNWIKPNCLAGGFVHAQWQSRAFYVCGKKLNGSGVLLDERRIFTAAHLGFEINKSFEVSNAEYGRVSALCVYICKRYDFAILKFEQLPEQIVVQGLLNQGWECCILVCLRFLSKLAYKVSQKFLNFFLSYRNRYY
jgi:hypothetical protein